MIYGLTDNGVKIHAEVIPATHDRNEQIGLVVDDTERAVVYRLSVSEAKDLRTSLDHALQPYD